MQFKNDEEKECVDEICEAGQYAFRDDEKKSAKYASDYLRRVRRRSAKKKDEETAGSVSG